MAKQKKTNHIEIPPVPWEGIAAVHGEDDFLEVLQRGLALPTP